MPSRPPSAAGAGLAAVARSILHWLLEGPAVVRGGDERGGVCGWVDEQGAAFVYPEAAGYYLTALAAAARSEPACAETARTRADLIVGWLRRHLQQGGLPPTRIHLRPHADDWRCQVRFAFDLAMLTRGLHDARALLPAAQVSSVLDQTIAEIDTLIDERGELRPWRPLQGGVVVPARWSTTAGFHQMKTAAALRTRPLAVSAPLAAACDAIAARWSRLPPPAGNLHAYTYGLEGCVLLGRARGDDRLLAQAAAACRAVLALRDAQGRMPANADGGPCRFDVLAQTLRLAALFAATEPAPLAGADELAAALAAAVDAGGAVPFGDGDRDAPRHQNVWASLFAWQALTLHVRMAAGERLSPADIDLLI